MVLLRTGVPILFAMLVVALMAWPAISLQPDNTARARAFVEAYTKKIRPLEIAANHAWWNANITGKDEHFQAKEEAQNQIDAVLSDKDFAEVKAIKEAGKIDDKIMARAIDLIYLAYLEKQVDPELLKKMTALANAVEKKFSTFRANVDGKEMDDKAVRKVLKTSKLSEQRQDVYEASKEVGKVVEPELLQLVKLRNEAAPASSVQELPRPAALPQRARRQGADQAVRQAGRPDARAVRGRQGGDRRQAGRAIAASSRRT